MIIREPRLEDIPTWSNMREALWPDPDAMNHAELNAYFQGTSIDIVQAYIAELEGRDIGFIELNIRSFVEGSRNSKVPYIEAWYIHPEFHNKGYGKRLIKKAESWAVDLGFAELGSDTQIENQQSIAIHKHLGFAETERIVCFLKQIT